MNSLIANSIEQDLNPFIVFGNDAKVLQYNNEAEYLLSFVSNKELYELALNYAPHTYGFKTSFIDLELNRNFYGAIMVGYENDTNLALRLYKNFNKNKTNNTSKQPLSKTNIYSLIEIAINNTNCTVYKYLDPSLPEIKLNAKAFLTLLNSAFAAFENCHEIKLSLKVKIAEKIVIENKKYPVCELKLQSQKEIKVDNLTKLAKEANCVVVENANSIVIEFALIL